MDPGRAFMGRRASYAVDYKCMEYVGFGLPRYVELEHVSTWIKEQDAPAPQGGN